MPRSEAAYLRTVAKMPGRALAGPERRFWLIVGLITLGGAILRVQIHDFDLPWLDKADELRLWFFAREVRGMPVPTAPAFGYSYPPSLSGSTNCCNPWPRPRAGRSPWTRSSICGASCCRST